MQDAKTYKIFWNNKQKNFWKVHKAFCEKFSITTSVTLNYWTVCELTEDQIVSFEKAIKSGFIRIIKI